MATETSATLHIFNFFGHMPALCAHLHGNFEHYGLLVLLFEIRTKLHELATYGASGNT